MKIKIITSFAILLLVIQAIGYLGSIDSNGKIFAEGVKPFSYYIGFNFFLIFSITLFYIARSLKKKQKRKEMADIIDSIGKPEKD
jgi:predicted permease